MSLPAYAMNQPTFPEMYERHLVGALFRPWALALLDEVDWREGARVLDVACGTGIVARLARERVGPRALVAAVDVSAPMLEVARRMAPQVDWRAGDAAALPLREGESFDLVFCQQGLQFFADGAAAAREMGRALASGGRLAVSTWRPIEESAVFREAHRIAEQVLGPIADRRHALGDDGELARLLTQAGFDEVRVRKATKPVRFAEPAIFARMNAMALVGMSGAAKELGEAERERAVETIATESLKVFAALMRSGELEFDTVSNVATATRAREGGAGSPTRG
jgi:ubiquinone/menaquinone biosynthesis C-methylase UbiE